jgi:hypothetical protein
MTNPATLSCFVGLALLGLSCAGPPAARPTAPLPPPRALAPAVTLPLPPPQASAPAPAPAPRAQPTPPPALRELAALFGQVCQLASLPDAPAGEPSFGCACCPPFDGCNPSDPPTETSEQVYFPSRFVGGSFTRAGADQRAMPMDGCEPHSENYGGLLVLERKSGGFALERYISGLNAAQCWGVRRDDGRDLLLCQRADVHQGTGEQLLFQLDLAEPDEKLLSAEPLVYVSDNEMSGCWSDKGTVVASVEMQPPRIATRVGRPQLTLSFDVRQGPVTDPYLARCKALEQLAEGAAPAPTERPRLLLAHKTEKLVFRFDGSKFAAATARPGR